MHLALYLTHFRLNSLSSKNTPKYSFSTIRNFGYIKFIKSSKYKLFNPTYKLGMILWFWDFVGCQPLPVREYVDSMWDVSLVTKSRVKSFPSTGAVKFNHARTSRTFDTWFDDYGPHRIHVLTDRPRSVAHGIPISLNFSKTTVFIPPVIFLVTSNILGVS